MSIHITSKLVLSEPRHAEFVWSVNQKCKLLFKILRIDYGLILLAALMTIFSGCGPTAATRQATNECTPSIFGASSNPKCGAINTTATTNNINPSIYDLTGIAGNSRVTLSWKVAQLSSDSLLTDFLVEFSAEDESTWTRFYEPISPEPGAVVTGLVNGKSYRFKVAAMTKKGQGDFVETADGVMPFGPPSRPRDLQVVDGNKSAVLNWTAPLSDGGRPISDYVISFSDDGGLSWRDFNDGISTSNQAHVFGLTNATSYIFRVSATNIAGRGEGVASPVVTVPFDIPYSPSNLSTTAGIKQVSLTWDPPENDNGRAISDYKIDYSSDNGASWTPFQDPVSTNTGAVVTSLTAGATYKFRVAAINEAGSGVWVTTNDGVTPLDLPAPPTNLKVIFENKQRTLSWTAPSLMDYEGTAVDYIVEFSTTSGDQWTILADEISVTPTALINALPVASNFKFRVRTQSTSGLSVPSEDLAMDIDGNVTISGGKTFVREQEIKLPISVYVMGGGMSFLKNGNYFKFESIGYDRGLAFSKWNGSVNTYFKVATLNSAPFQHTFSAQPAIDKFLADNSNTTTSYASIELAMVDADGILIAYTNGNNGGNASPLNIISLADPRLTISAGEHPSLLGLSVSNSWMGGCNGSGSYQAPFCKLTSPPAPVVLFERVTLLADDYKYTTVTDEGNLGDTVESYEPNMLDSVKRSGFGAVSYRYGISKNLVTMEDYAEFLNSVAQTDDQQIYNPTLATDTQAGGITRSGSSGSYRYQVVSGKSLRPVTYVSWLNAARYVNWLHNGKPVGTPGPNTTESGAYQLNANNDYADYPRSINAGYFIPTEDEWYKAAYYKGGGTNAGYWRFATQSDVHPGAATTDSSISNRANFNSTANGTTNVGLFVSSPSFYGTFDQTGNVWQWLEGEGPVSGQKARRGGSWANTWPNADPANLQPSRLSSEVRSASPISSASEHLGFRVGKTASSISQ